MRFLSQSSSPKRAGRKLAVAAVVALSLIAAETYAAWHRADVQAHATGDACKICLTISSFANGNVSHAIVVAPVAVSAHCVPWTATALRTRDVVPPQARGPPIPS